MPEALELVGCVLNVASGGLSLLYFDRTHTVRYAYPLAFTGSALLSISCFADGDHLAGTFFAWMCAWFIRAWWNDEDQRRRRRKLREAALAHVVAAGGRLMVVRPATGQP